MSEAGKSAVFLSYASQDAEAARRICEALRAGGVEVWFDQNELVGGDAWDAKIRRQIAECALFVPIISANTQARKEGYFRLEWKLAAQRTHMIADGTPFLLPVVIDATRDAEALVPAELKAVQWTRLPGGETTTAFREQISKLLGREFSAAPPAPAVERPMSVTRPASRTPRLVVAGCGLALAVVIAIWQPWKKASPSRTTPSQATELAGLRARIVPERWGSADYEVMRPALDRWIQSHPDDSDAMALRSCISSLQVLRTLDFGTKVLSDGKADAERASRLAPDSPLAELALGYHHVAMMTRGGEAEAARPHLERALAALPQDILARYAQMGYFAFSLQLDRVRQAADAWLIADPAATFPRWCVAYSALIERKAEEAEKWAERGVSDGEAATTVRSLSTLFEINFFLRANLRAARETLERVPATARSHHRLVYARWFLALAGRQWDEAIQELARVPDALLLDRCFRGPKSLLAGIAHRKAGRAAPAVAQFREAERVLREQLASDADNEDLRLALALALAYQGRADDARSELGAVEPLLRGRRPYLYSGHAREMIAETYAVLGEVEGALPWLRLLFAESSAVPYTPASFRLDVRFDGILQDPRVQALLAESAPRETTAADPKSVAVLPFANHSGDPAQDYVSDGLTVEIQTALLNESDLRVAGPTSAFAFKGKAVPGPEIARALNVAQVVEGSVRKSGNQVRITVALTRASDGFSEPLGTFTEKLDDLFALQEKVARVVVEKLTKRTTTATRLVAQTTNPAAYDLFLRARAIDERTGADAPPREMREAIALLSRAVEVDPKFARAWAQLGKLHGIMFANFADHTEARRAQAQAAADTAMRLAPELPDVRAGLGLVHYSFRDYARASEQFQWLVDRFPNDARAWRYLGFIQRRIGHFAEALPLLQRSVAADPTDIEGVHNLARHLFWGRRFTEATQVYRRLGELRPGEIDHTYLPADLATLALDTRDSVAEGDAFFAQLEPAAANSPEMIARRMSWAQAKGDAAEFVRLVGQSRSDYLATVSAAFAMAHLGDRAAARAKLAPIAERLRSAPEREPGNFLSWLGRGALGAFDGDLDAARKDVSRAIALVPAATDALGAGQVRFLAAGVLAWAGDKDAAFELLTDLMKVAPAVSLHRLRRNWFYSPLQGDPRWTALFNDPKNNAPLF